MIHLKILLFFVLFVGKTVAQDIHFSQFYQAPLQLNPALTGMFNGEYRLMGNFRSQWFSVPISYTTFKAAFDARLLPNKLEKDVFGAGVMFYHDQAGDSRMSTLYAVGSLAFSKRIAKFFFLGLGANIGYAQRRFNQKNLTFDDQFNGDVFDPSIVSADIANLSQSTFSYFDVAVGMNFRFQKSKRFFLDAGAALHHPHQPKHTFQNGITRLGAKMIYHFNSSFPVHKQWDIMPHSMVQTQATYTEWILGALARYHFNENPGRETALSFGLSYRNADALVPVIGFSHQAWQVGISYDVNISKFVPATAKNGGIEISFSYIWRRVPKLPTIKICPIL